jgi:serine/threonine-protein kinase
VLKALVSEAPAANPVEPGLALPVELVAICRKAMSKPKAERFKDAGAMVRELRAFRDGRVVSVYAYSKRELLRRFIARNKLLIALSACAILAILAGGLTALRFGIQAHQARILAEEAVGKVTATAERAMERCRDSAGQLDAYLARLRMAMEGVAGNLAGMDLGDSRLVHPHLAGLQAKFTEVESFLTVRAPGILAAAVPTTYAHVLGQDISAQEHIRWIMARGQPVFSKLFSAVEGFMAVSFQVPVMEGTLVKGTVSCLLRPEKFIPAALVAYSGPGLDLSRIWCMQGDGAILYDIKAEEIGRNLFRDEIYADFPELQALGRRVAAEESGLGHYLFRALDRTKIIHKVSAWHTFSPTGQAAWKIVVVEPYLVP